MAIETEIKLRFPGHPDDARALLARHGFHAAHRRELQIDQLFDRDGELRSGDRLLRVRSTGGRWVLTYKGPASRAPHKSREEVETEVASGEALLQILAELGFTPTFVYEKYRTEFRAPGQPGVVALDEVPIGTFLELEGPGDWIDTTVQILGYTTEEYVVASYATLYREHCRQHGGVLSEMKF